jgi:GTP-binding protein HflX
MTEPKRDELRVQAKRAVLAAVVLAADRDHKDRALDEIAGLAKTAGVHIVGELVQVRESPRPSTCLGSGKLEELHALVKQTGADLVIFDNNLTPAQGRNLEKQLDTVIVDRSELILDIFASRAQTYEAKLQVELAQLLYFRPRLKRLWTHLERIEGGVGAGRGPGEKQLETDRRLLDKRVAELKRRLKEVEKRRRSAVAHRDDQITVSLVGYTNAGKSTLMRALTGADVLVADKLFATLDTRTRRWQLPHWGEILLSDTVGFVRDLPHHLVASFRSTLEEARMADLLLHVVDASNPQAEQQVQTVYEVLDEIGVDNDNAILVLNKTDAIADRSLLDVLRLRYEDTVCVSAATREGLDRLTDMVAARLGRGFVDADVETHVGDGKLFAYLAEHADVLSTDYSDSRATVHCRIARRFLDRISENGVVIRIQEPDLAAQSQ